MQRRQLFHLSSTTWKGEKTNDLATNSYCLPLAIFCIIWDNCFRTSFTNIIPRTYNQRVMQIFNAQLHICNINIPRFMCTVWCKPVPCILCITRTSKIKETGYAHKSATFLWPIAQENQLKPKMHKWKNWIECFTKIVVYVTKELNYWII